MIESTTVWRYSARRFISHEAHHIVAAEFIVPVAVGFMLTIYLMLVRPNKQIPALVIVPALILSGSAFSSVANPIAVDRFASFAIHWFAVAMYLAVGFANFFTNLRNAVLCALFNADRVLEHGVANTLFDECKFWIERSIFIAATFLGALGVVAVIIWTSALVVEGEKFVLLVSAGLAFGFGVLAIGIWAASPLMETMASLRQWMLSERRPSQISGKGDA